LYSDKWPLPINKKNSCAESILSRSTTIKTKPSFNITSSIKITLNSMSKESPTLWRLTPTEKNNSNTKKLNEFLNSNKIFLSPPKKVQKFSPTLKTKIKSPITAMFLKIWLKAISFSINKITNLKCLSLCAKKSIRPSKVNHFRQLTLRKNPFLIKDKIIKQFKLKTL